MPWMRDAEGVRWSVRRVWWPFGEIEWTSSDDGIFFWIGFLLTAFVVIAWPIWLGVRFAGVTPWTIKVRRKGNVVRSEKVKGFGASRVRMRAIAEEVRGTSVNRDEPESGAVVH